jgi:hypothetical protein
MWSGYDEVYMEAVKVPAIHGWLWIKQGYVLFKKNPLLWMVLTAIGAIGLFGIAMIPVIGDPLSTLLFPVVLAGFMYGCRALDQNEELELSHLFAGFRQYTQHLITLGGINLVGQLLILGVMMITGGASMVSIIMSNEPVTDPTVVAQALAGAGFAMLIGVVLFCILVMAMQFAPMLVIFDDMKPIAALKTSLRGFMRNALALTVYGLLLLPFAVVASLPVMLGWLFLLPVIITSLYAIYSDLFPVQVQGESKSNASSTVKDPPGSKSEPDTNSAGVSGVSWYNILGVDPNSSTEEIRRTYKSLMSQYHPDKVASLGEELRVLAEKKAKEINAAYKEAMYLRGESPDDQTGRSG